MEDILSIQDGIAEANYTTGEAKLNITPTTSALSELLVEHFADRGHITVALSGGLDSQFSANVAKKYADSASAVTFRFMWGDSIVNGQDVATAQKLCEVIDLDLIIEDFDLQPLLDRELRDYLQHYRSISPHISTQLSAIKNSQHIQGTLLMGGEVPMATMDSDGNVKLIGIPSSRQQNRNVTPTSFVFTHYAPFEYLHIHNGIDVIRDPLWVSPEILYSACMHNLTVMLQHKCAHQTVNLDLLKSNTTQYKIKYYTSIDRDFVFLPPLHKQTGFESLNMYLASQTGNYDEFDLRYRHPLMKNIFSTDWATPTLFDEKEHAFRITDTVVNGVDIHQLEQQLTDSVADLTLTATNTYNFNW